MVNPKFLVRVGITLMIEEYETLIEARDKVPEACFTLNTLFFCFNENFSNFRVYIQLIESYIDCICIYINITAFIWIVMNNSIQAKYTHNDIQ